MGNPVISAITLRVIVLAFLVKALQAWYKKVKQEKLKAEETLILKE
ncbi:MAG: hypothetical protein FWE37_00795 [Spirochaetaceae bacterium]|nr:hypothetical protein [Spirochaetaceae bacterium]